MNLLHLLMKKQKPQSKMLFNHAIQTMELLLKKVNKKRVLELTMFG